MADKRCENGHFIDESWDLCPYCPEGSGEVEVPIVRPSRPTAETPHRPVVGAHAAGDPFPPVERTVAAARIDVSAHPKRYVVGWLVGLNGDARGESYPVRIGRNIIGRDRRSDIVILDDQASSHHADLVFRPEERRFILMDHNSTNGTYVNETEIAPRCDLEGADVIRIGSHRLMFQPLIHDGLFWDEEGPLQ